MSLPDRHWTVHLALMAIGVIYGIFSFALKYLMAHEYLDQFEMLFVRLVLSGLLVAVIEFGWFRTRFESRADFLRVLSLGLVGVFLVQTTTVFGVYWTTVFHTTLLMCLIPLITLILGVWLYGESLKPYKALGMAIAFFGVLYLLFFRGAGTHLLPESYLLGDAILLLNATGYAWFLMETKPLLRKYNAFSVVAWWYMVSAVAVTLCFFGLGLAGVRNLASDLHLEFLGAMDASAWWMLGYVIVFGSIISYALANYALARTSASTVSAYIFIQPLVAACLGVSFLHEPFTFQMAMAGLLIVAGVMLATRSYIKTGAMPQA